MIDLFAEYAHIERWCKYKTLKIVQAVFNLEDPKLENYIKEAEEAGGEVPPYREIAMIRLGIFTIFTRAL